MAHPGIGRCAVWRQEGSCTASILLACAMPSTPKLLLARIDPDALSPREALEALYRLKSLHPETKP